VTACRGFVDELGKPVNDFDVETWLPRIIVTGRENVEADIVTESSARCRE
jgi:hypothetical protein